MNTSSKPRNSIKWTWARSSMLTGALVYLLTLCAGLKAGEISQSVIQVQNQAEPGSGFFLKVGSQIIFVTAKHVLGSSGEKVSLSLPDGSKLDIALKDQVPIDGIDSAVIIIKGSSQPIIPLEASVKQLEPSQILSVWGFPVSDQSTSSRLENRSGAYLGVSTSVQDGYNLLYGAQTQIGFSGGPILDQLGNVVGMHGRSESIQSVSGQSTRTGKALGIPIGVILAAITKPSRTGASIDEKALAAEAGRASMKKVYDIVSSSSLSDQLLEELLRAEKAPIPKYCIEIGKAYYYTFFSSLPDLSKASASQTITKNIEGVDPAYFALGSMIARRAADFKKSLAYDRILEQKGSSGYLQYSERRLIDEVQQAIQRCSKL